MFRRFGVPEEVAEVAVGGSRDPKPGEVRLRMRFAPVNPADINYFEGTYGTKPELPAVPGNEGAGEVVAIGDEVSGFAEGDAVIVIGQVGLWEGDLCVRAENVIRLPDGIDLQQASMLKVNPPTALLLLREFADLERGDWVAQNAANSGVGRSVIQLARERGLRTINFVRREELVPELTQLGGDVVLLDDESGLEEAKKLDSLPSLALNAVGGDSALRLMDLLAPEGVHVTYGAMSRRSLKVPNKFLIFKQLQLRGFWITQWMKRASRGDIESVFGVLAGMMADGRLRLPVEKVYRVDEVRDALAHAQRSERTGKILLEF